MMQQQRSQELQSMYNYSIPKTQQNQQNHQSMDNYTGPQATSDGNHFATYHQNRMSFPASLNSQHYTSQRHGNYGAGSGAGAGAGAGALPSSISNSFGLDQDARRLGFAGGQPDVRASSASSSSAFAQHFREPYGEHRDLLLHNATRNGESLNSAYHPARQNEGLASVCNSGTQRSLTTPHGQNFACNSTDGLNQTRLGGSLDSGYNFPTGATRFGLDTVLNAKGNSSYPLSNAGVSRYGPLSTVGNAGIYEGAQYGFENNDGIGGLFSFPSSSFAKHGYGPWVSSDNFSVESGGFKRKNELARYNSNTQYSGFGRPSNELYGQSKRKRYDIESLIKETMELHALYREGLTDNESSESYSDDSDDDSEDLECDSDNSSSETSLHIGQCDESKDDKKLNTDGNKRLVSTDGNKNVACADGIERLVSRDVITAENNSQIEAEPHKKSLIDLSSWENAPMKDLCSGYGDSVKSTEEGSQKEPVLRHSVQEQYIHPQMVASEGLAKLINNSSDVDDSDSDNFMDEGEDNHDPLVQTGEYVKSREDVAFEYFKNCLEENQELRKFYIEQSTLGPFLCLVCSSIKGKSRKLYTGLVSVVMHASKVIKTKRKPEHRGYSRAVCDLMDWDISRPYSLPADIQPRACLPLDEEQTSSNGDVRRDEVGAPEAGDSRQLNEFSDVSPSSVHGDENFLKMLKNLKPGEMNQSQPCNESVNSDEDDFKLVKNIKPGEENNSQKCNESFNSDEHDFKLVKNIKPGEMNHSQQCNESLNLLVGNEGQCHEVDENKEVNKVPANDTDGQDKGPENTEVAEKMKVQSIYKPARALCQEIIGTVRPQSRR